MSKPQLSQEVSNVYISGRATRVSNKQHINLRLVPGQGAVKEDHQRTERQEIDVWGQPTVELHPQNLHTTV